MSEWIKFDPENMPDEHSIIHDSGLNYRKRYKLLISDGIDVWLGNFCKYENKSCYWCVDGDLKNRIVRYWKPIGELPNDEG